MKKLIIIVSAIVVSISMAKAQFATDLGKVGSDLYGFFTDAGSTNNNWGGTVGGLYSDKQWGGFADVQYQLSSNNISTSVGFVGAYIPSAHTFYDGSFSCRLSSTLNVPVVGTVGVYAESGPGYNFQTHSAMVQSFTGVQKDITIQSKYHLILGGGVGNISDRSGVCYTAHVTFIW